ncbi:MAG: hypothetical protein AAGA61_09670 [Pseudomonadota bacterium]
MKHLFVAAVASLLCLPSASVAGPENHADYVVLGKSINHRQSHTGELELLNTVFFAEVFETDSGTVSNAVLRGPGEAAEGIPFSGDGIHFLAGTRQYTIEALTANFPDTTYRFDFDTPEGDVRGFPATFVRDAGEMRNPGPIAIALFQNGAPADPQAIDPDLDLTVRWSPFAKGAADPNGIIDDMIYVIFGDCLGNEIGHSGHAISDPDALTYAATEYVISADLLAPGRPFQLEVEHSNMDTAIERNIEIIVTYAATSFLDLRTTGVTTAEPACPAVPYAMDGGQTDRERR